MGTPHQIWWGDGIVHSLWKQRVNIKEAGGLRAIRSGATLRLRGAKAKCPEFTEGPSLRSLSASTSTRSVQALRRAQCKHFDALSASNKHMKGWFVYILQCKDGSFYTGVTPNLKRRFQEHKEGKGGKYTLEHKPIKILFSETFNTKQEALNREKQLKGWSHRKKENLAKFGKP